MGRRWIVRLVLALVLVLAGVLGLLAQQGYRAYIVRSGSMRPALPVGSLVIDRPVDQVRAGQIVTVTPQPGELVTHRVAAVSAAGITTKGDANNGPDWWRLQPGQVLGRVIVHIPAAGYLLVFLRQPSGLPALVALGIALALAWSVFFGSEPATESQSSGPDGRAARGWRRRSMVHG